ncbi:MAG: sodium:calcium antiporter [Spirochaetales bacterium]|uniref:Sodium:calcium antiporter n=1 Tax=Candidatus Thalassospirochaeta sargassi TaxID=3119039 RepID=A0AAJ1IA30_9SPIO|nr:sodium:calcium antiporter [Spirochaetales bacterium]
MNIISYSAAMLFFLIMETARAIRIKKPSITLILFPAFFVLSLLWKSTGFLTGGILILIMASDRLVKGGIALAGKFGVSPFFIGIFIIGLGTSSPELFVNLLSALRGDTALAMGNILGSNISNMGIVIGAAGLIAGTMKLEASLIKKEIPIMLAASILLLLLVLDFPPFSNEADSSNMVLTLQDGLLLFLCLIMYLLYTINSMNKPDSKPELRASAIPDAPTLPIEPHSAVDSTFNILTGIAGLYFGGEFIISSSVSIAEALGAGTMTLGIIVGLGTSLPELATGINCALKNETDLVVGNVLGSNIFNILLILGLTSIIRPVFLTPDVLVHFGFLIGISIIFFISLGSERKLNRIEAALLLAAGLGYLGFSIVTG